MHKHNPISNARHLETSMVTLLSEDIWDFGLFLFIKRWSN